MNKIYSETKKRVIYGIVAIAGLIALVMLTAYAIKITPLPHKLHYLNTGR